MAHPDTWGEEGTVWGGPQQLRIGLAAWHSFIAARNMPIKPSINIFFNEQTPVEENRGGAAAQGVPVGVEAELPVAFWWRFADDNISLQCVRIAGPISGDN